MINLVFFDTETTGTAVGTDGVVQFGALLMPYDEESGELQAPRVLMNTYANPGKPIDPESSKVHGIVDADVTYAPFHTYVLHQFSMVLQSLSRSGDVVLAGQNIMRFDIPLVNAIYPQAGFVTYPFLDTYTIALREWPEMPHKLEELYGWYTGMPAVKAHDAAADCYMVAMILQKYLAECQQQDPGFDLETLIEDLMEPRALPVYPFGKYKGVPANEVPQSYYRWCAQNFTEVHPDVELTICEKLNIVSFEDQSRRLGDGDVGQIEGVG